VLEILHSRRHSVSHYQIDLVVVGGAMSVSDVGGTLVNFAPGHINVATAWDNDGLEPLIEIILTGFKGLSADGIAGVIPVASGYLDVGSSGVEVGNFITADLATVAVPFGRYAVTVFADKLEPATARRVHFHFRNVKD
jgi:hypothetical protein